jgi:hypothetical protein
MRISWRTVMEEEKEEEMRAMKAFFDVADKRTIPN